MRISDVINYGRSKFSPETFTPVYNDEDLDTFEDLFLHTLAGDVITTRIEHAIGDGFEPKAVWKRPSKHGKDVDEQEKNLSQFDDLIEELQSIGERRNIDLEQNVRDMSINSKIFGRGMLAYEFDDEKQEIPYSIKPIHPRLLGMVYVDQFSWQVQGVQVHTSTDFAVDWDDMMYFTNHRYSPRFRSAHYGLSDLQRVAGQCRALRTITEYDILEITKTMWAGYGIVLVDQENYTEEEKQEDLYEIRKNFDSGPGRISVIGKQGEKGIDIEQFKFEADVAGITSLIQTLEQSIIGHGGVPAALMGREADANMATLFGKVRYFLHGPVRFDRRWIGRTISSQWYERVCKYLKPAVLQDIRIETSFQNLPVDAWMGAIGELSNLKQLLPNLPDNEILRLADLEYMQADLAKANEKAEQMQQEQQEEQMEQMQQQQGMPPQGMPQNGAPNPANGNNAPDGGRGMKPQQPQPSQQEQMTGGEAAVKAMPNGLKKELGEATEDKGLRDKMREESRK